MPSSAAARPEFATAPSASTAQPVNSRKTFETLSLACILLLAALLRARGWLTHGLEQDELYTVLESQYLWDVNLAPGIHSRPLYFLIQHVLLDVLPMAPWAWRLLPFVLGVATVFISYKVANRIFGSPAGLGAAFFMAIAPWHMHTSTFARYWSLVCLASLIYIAHLWQAYEYGRKRDHLIALAALMVGSATHPSFAFTAAGVALGISVIRDDGSLGIRWPSRDNWTYLWAPYLLFVAAAFAALKLSGTSNSLQNWGGRGWLASVRLVPAVVEWLTPALSVAALCGAILLLKELRPGVRRFAAMALSGVTVTCVLLLTASTRTDVYAEYATAILPLAFLAIGGLFWTLSRAIPRLRTGHLIAVAAVISAGVLPSTVSHLLDGSRFDYRPAYEHVRKTAPQITMVTWPLIIARHYAPDLKAIDLRMRTDYLNELLRRESDFWLVGSYRRYGLVVDDAGVITAWIGRHCSLEHTHERARLDYRVYRVNLYRCRSERVAGVPTPG